MSLLSAFLLPFAWLYAGVMAVRNWLYDKGLKTSASFSVPVISVGNLRVGGTGKTPHVAWVVRQLLAQGEKPAVLSRGYGRRTRGYRLAAALDTAATLGDEPLQHHQDFGAEVPVAVCEDRRAGIAQLLQQQPSLSAIVLDDAYQHRRVQPALSILLTEQQRPFYADRVLPAGRLRESRGGARRADVVIVTKCTPHLPESTRQAIAAKIRHYTRPKVPVLFSTYRYGAPVPITGKTISASPDIVLLTGIAHPRPLRDHLQAIGYRITYHAAFADHHAFSVADIAGVATQCRAGQCVFTTQKDAARLLAPELATVIVSLPIFYIPIDVQFLGDGAACLQQVLTSLFQPQAVV